MSLKTQICACDTKITIQIGLKGEVDNPGRQIPTLWSSTVPEYQPKVSMFDDQRDSFSI